MKRSRYKRRKNPKFIAVVFTLLILITALTYLIGSKNNNMPPSETGTPTLPATESTPPSTTSQTPTPDLSETPTPPASDPNNVSTEDHGILPITGTVEESGQMSLIKSKVEDYISGLDGKYGVSFIDLATGESFGVNDRDSYVAASTSKLFMNLMLYTKMESGDIDPESILKYTSADFEPGSGIIQNEPYGTEYTVRETSRLSIIYSDNCGINMIIRILGIEEICQYVLDLGGDIYYDRGHVTSPHDLTIVAQELYRLYLNNPDLYGELIYNLENTVWKDRIRAGVPDDVKVAHKIGNQTRVASDVGIVFGSHPFAIAISTRDVDETEARNNLAIITKMIYDEVEAYAK